MSIILVCLALEAKIIKYIMIWSPGPNISNIGSSWNLARACGWASWMHMLATLRSPRSPDWQLRCPVFEMRSLTLKNWSFVLKARSSDAKFFKVQPPWLKSLFFQINAISKIQACNFQGGKSPCGMQLAHPGLVNSKILTKPIKHVIIYV